LSQSELQLAGGEQKVATGQVQVAAGLQAGLAQEETSKRDWQEFTPSGARPPVCIRVVSKQELDRLHPPSQNPATRLQPTGSEGGSPRGLYTAHTGQWSNQDEEMDLRVCLFDLRMAHHRSTPPSAPEMAYLPSLQNAARPPSVSLYEAYISSARRSFLPKIIPRMP
jgi:hypothetical protein